MYPLAYSSYNKAFVSNNELPRGDYGQGLYIGGSPSYLDPVYAIGNLVSGFDCAVEST